MRTFIFLFSMTFLFENCQQASLNKNDRISISCQRLAQMSESKDVDIIKFKQVLDSAFFQTQTFSTRQHDSLFAIVSRLLGNELFKTNELEAREIYLKGIAIGSRQLLPTEDIMTRLYRNTALTYYNLDDFKQALTFFDSVKIISQEPSAQILKIQDFMKIAECYQRLNDKKSAKRIFKETEPLAQKHYQKSDLAAFYGQYSNCLRKQKEYQDASEKAQQGLDILQTLDVFTRNDSNVLASIYYSLAYALHESGAYKSAEYYYLQAIPIYKKQNNWNSYKRSLSNMGILYRFDKQFGKAEKTLTEGITLFDKTDLDDYNIRLKASFYVNRSEVYLETKQYKKAIADHDSAIYFFKLYEKRPSLTAVMMQARPVLLSVLSDKAKASIALAENGSYTEGYQKALKLTQQSIQLADDIRADYFSDDAKLTLANDIKPALEKAIDVCQKLYIKTKDKQYLDQAFGFIEYSRSMVLYENARLENQLPDDLKKENDALKKLERDLIGNNNVEKLQEYLRLKRQFREKIKALNRNQLAPVSELQAALIKDDKTAFIEYFVGDSAVFIFSLSKNDKQLFQFNKPKDLDKQIENLRYEITQEHPVSNSTAFEQQSKAIYSLLLQQTLKQLPTTINQLIIAPDGILNYLPFDVLIKNDNNFSNSNTQLKANKPSKDSLVINQQPSLKDTSFLKLKVKRKFLLYDYTVSYAYSANLLLKQKQPKSKEKLAPKLFAGFASKYEEEDSVRRTEHSRGTRGSAYDLPFAKKEVQDISSIMGFWYGDTFTGKNATEAVFKVEASKYRILHFAMHSWADDKDPAFSRLLFTLTPHDTTDDNNLTAAELYTMKLKADLAVLSACNTGFGTINKGEGVMSLARAFAHANVPATITSLWKVDDKATRDIMVNFYTNLKQGMSKDSALSEAKKAYLENAPELNAANPYYWAGFVPTGNMDAMDLDVAYPLSMWGILGGLIAASGLGFWYWKRNRR